MPKWKHLDSLSDQSQKAREAAFEAEMVAMIVPGKSQPATISSTTPTREAIQISVTKDGQTTLYNLETVPCQVRQQILNAWRPSTTAIIPPPLLTSSPASRQKTMRTALALNLFFPCAGQFYFGQRFAGSAYAISFITCFAAVLVLFNRAYFAYLRLSTAGDIMEAGNLEQLTQVFHTGTLAALSLIGTAVYIASAIHLFSSRRLPR